MIRDYRVETEKRVAFIREVLLDAKADGVIFGNSGGKDAALAGILCKMACDNTVGVITPCGSKRNYGEDKDHALVLAEKFGIETRYVDLTETRDALMKAVEGSAELTAAAVSNIAPRLRMAAWYAMAQSENRLVAGTGNRSERYMGYFTKFGDGAHDFNPIADLTVTEVYEFLRYLDVPACIIDKVPSAGLFDGQTDEGEMGVTYAAIDRYILDGTANERDLGIIERYHRVSGHKRVMPRIYGDGK
jgi:NAD+ synthase